jgi:hypothetical protein
MFGGLLYLKSCNIKLTNKKFFSFLFLPIMLYGCGGGGGGSATVAAVLSGTTYSGSTQTITNSNGSVVTNTATGSSVTWASDHVTRTTTYTFPDSTTNAVVGTFNPTTSTPVFSAAVYPVTWTTTGTVTPPVVSAIINTYGDGFTSTVADGSATKPFAQAALSAQSITDLSNYVTSSTTTYDLRWGIPDKDGPGYASLFPSGSPLTLDSAVTIWGNTVSGQGCFSTCGATIGAPHPEVIDAWNNGWTGKGVNILIEDWLTEEHGLITSMLASRYAIGSVVYGFDMPTELGIYNYDGTVASPLTTQNIGVINVSYGADLVSLIGHDSPWSDAELASAVAAYDAEFDIYRYTGVTGFANFSLTDAVITKAAGNDGINSDRAPFVNALSAFSSIVDRLLIVGALNQAGGTDFPATIAWYSNTAGDDATVQSRFVVASGTTPFGTGDIAFNGVNVDEGIGTSYAAPRAAGYVAIVRSKFPNLNAVKTSSILLDTATYETLTCYYTVSGCDKAIYGQGEISLSRALAPVGTLR